MKMKRNPLLKQSNPILKPSPYTRETNHIEQVIHQPNPLLKHSTSLNDTERKFVKRWYDLFEFNNVKPAAAPVSAAPAPPAPASAAASSLPAPSPIPPPVAVPHPKPTPVAVPHPKPAPAPSSASASATAPSAKPAPTAPSPIAVPHPKPAPTTPAPSSAPASASAPATAPSPIHVAPPHPKPAPTTPAPSVPRHPTPPAPTTSAPTATKATVDVSDSDTESTTSENTQLPPPSVELPPTPEQPKATQKSEKKIPITSLVPDEDDEEFDRLMAELDKTKKKITEDEQKQLHLPHETTRIHSDLKPLFTDYPRELEQIYKDNPVRDEEKTEKYYVYLDKNPDEIDADKVQIRKLSKLRGDNKQFVEEHLYGATKKNTFLTVLLPPKSDPAYEGRANQLKKYIKDFTEKLNKQDTSKLQQTLTGFKASQSNLASALAAAKAKQANP